MRKQWKPILASALLAIISFPVAFYTPNLIPGWLSALVVWFSYVPLAYYLRGATPQESFRAAYLFGLLSKGGMLFWNVIAMQKYGGLSFLTAGSIFLLLISYLALLPATGFWIAAKCAKWAPRWLAAPLALTLLEWILFYFPVNGFPWTTPAYSLAGALGLIQVADIIGTSGLNFIIFLVNFALVEALLFKSFRKWAAPGISILLLTVGMYGAVRLRQVDHAALSASHVRVGLLQGNIPQDMKWNPQSQRGIIDTYMELSHRAAQAGAKLIVWPEAAYPIMLQRDTQQLFPSHIFDGTADLVVGAPTFHSENQKRYYQNSAFVVAPGGSIRMRYDKQHLVPFGEYVPLEDFFLMRYIVPVVAGNFSAGDHPELGEVDQHRYGILICYEILFSDISVDLVRKGAHFLVNITNDAWFDETSGPYQHAQFGSFRAIETRRSVVRAANTGVTTWFDPSGRMHSPTTLFTRTLLMADIPINNEITFYVRYPHLIPILLALVLLGSLGFGYARRRKTKP